jgi:hypothetical protein
MAISAALTSGQQGVAPIPGVDFMGIFTITWDSSSLVTGEDLTPTATTGLGAYFSTIDAVIPCGVSAIELAGYIPAFIFTPGAAVATGSVLATLNRIPLLEIDDGVDIDPQPLVPANGLDVAALGTTQIMVFGKAA